MKIGFLFLFTHLVLTKYVRSSSVKAPLDVITLDDITPDERKHLEYLNSLNEPREKRASEGILSLLTKGSASASSHGSSSSSGHKDHHSEPEEYDHVKSLDFWDLKKSVLNTLLQTAKAIKGAAIALTGKLIKGSGYLVSAKGKLISSKGEAVTNLGKKIAASAILSPSKKHYHSSYSEHPHEEYHSDYGTSSHHEPAIAPPSSSGGGYEHPQSHYPEKYATFEDITQHKTIHGLPSGIMILKKIPRHYHEAQESVNIPDFKPLEPRKPEGSGSGYASLLTNIFTTSSHAQPHISESVNTDYSKSPPPHKSLDHDNSNDSVSSIKPVTEDQPLDKPANIDNAPFSAQTYVPPSPLIDIPHNDFSDFSDFSTHPGFYLNNLAANINNLPNIDTFNTFPTQFSAHYLNTQFPAPYQNIQHFDTFGPNNLQDPRYLKHSSTLRTSQQSKDRPLAKLPNLSTSLTHNHVKRTPTKSMVRINSPASYDLLKSLSFQLGPNGPVKI